MEFANSSKKNPRVGFLHDSILQGSPALNASLRRFRFVALAAAFLFMHGTAGAQSPAPKKGDEGVRLKNIARIVGMRSNQLLGYGLVVGLPGTGDSRSRLASRSIRNLLGRLGQKLPLDNRAKNIAAVLVTAEIPPISRKGDRLNVTVSSIGDARSLEGGVLIRTALRAANNNIYAAAQGVITTGGRAARRGGPRGGKTVGLVLNGGMVERDTNAAFVSGRRLRVKLRKFDFSTLQEVKKSAERTFAGLKSRVDGGELILDIPSGMNPFEFAARLQEMTVQVKYPASVVINERTGTVVMGGDIRVDPVAITRGGLRLFVTNARNVSSGVSKELNIKYGPGGDKKKRNERTREFSGKSVSEIVAALNAMGAGVEDVIAILEALRDSGALHAKLIVN